VQYYSSVVNMIRRIPFAALCSLLLIGATSRVGALRGYNEQHDFLASFLDPIHHHYYFNEEQYSTLSLQQKLLEKAVEHRVLANNNNNYYYQGDDDSNKVQYNGGNAQDLTDSALKYVACKNIHSFSSDYGYLEMNRFVTLRLCPSRSCSSYNAQGCSSSSQYVDYLLPLTDYLQVMNAYHFAAKQKYCEVCAACTTFQVDAETDDNSSSSAGDDNAYAYSAATDDDNYYAGDDFQRDLYQYNYQNNNNGGGYYDANGNYYNSNYGGGGGYYYNNNNRNQYQYNNDDAGNSGNNQYGYKSYYTDDAAAQNDDDDYYNDDHYSRYELMHYSFEQCNVLPCPRTRWLTEHDFLLLFNNSNGATYPWYIGSDGECIYETVCSNYKSVCQDDITASDETYFDCALHEDGMGYAAAHCAADGVTIEIGRYSEETCSTFTDETVASLDPTYYDQTCLSCNGQESFSLVSDEEIADGTVETYPFCSALYDEAAQCSWDYASDEVR